MLILAYTLKSQNRDIKTLTKMYMQRWCMPTNLTKIQI